MTAFISLFRKYLGAPIVMVGSFAIAILFAIGHHLFYRSLDGQAISSTLFNQQTNTAGGTAFAFLVRAFLVISLGTAYAQLLWHTLLRHKLSISTMDSLSSLLASAFELASIHLTWRYPAVVILALVAWIVPFSTVVPPATLSVRSVISTHHKMQNVTTLDLRNAELFHTGFVFPYTPANQSTPTSYSVWPYLSFSAVAKVVAVQGALPMLPLPALNSSYRLSFPGPALKCESMPYPDILGNWSQSCPGYTWWYRRNVSVQYTDRNWAGYLSWIPSPYSSEGDRKPIDRIPQHRGGGNGSVDCDRLDQSSRFTAYDFPNTPAELFVAMKIGLFYPANATTFSPSLGPGPWSLTRCELQNASYTVDFKSANGQQLVTVIDKQLEPLKLVSELSYESAGTPIYNYLTALAMLGQMTVGAFSWEDVLYGSFRKVPDIFSTQFAASNEAIDFFYRAGFNMLDPAIRTDPRDVHRSGPVARVLEDIFQNITLAMLTFPYVGAKSAHMNVTHWTPENLYTYSWKNLVLSYGIGILVSGIAVALGCFTVFLNGASYSNRYSTFLRTTRWHQVDDVATEGGYDGSDPLPNSVARLKIQLGPAEQGDQADEGAVGGFEATQGKTTRR